jgi:ligand-binding sensor domain-containing protein/signal transduction histidine kinase
LPLILGALIWLASSSLGFAQLVVDNWTTENGLPQNSINDILQTRDRYLWLATHGGLVRFDGVRFVVFDRSIEGIESQRLRALHEDREGTLWAASEDGMLVRYRGGRFTTFGREHGLPPVGGVRIEEDEDGVLWVSWLDRFTRYDGTRFETLLPSQLGGPVLRPPTPYLDTWWGETPAGIAAFVRGRVRTYEIRALLDGASVARVTHDRTGNVWIGTDRGDVIRASDRGSERFTHHRGCPAGSPFAWLMQGGNGDVWWAAADGLRRIRNGECEPIRTPELHSIDVRSFYADDEGSTWFGTPARGVFRLHDAAVSVLQERDGVSLRIAYAILQDRTGAVWISTGGLQQYANGRVTRFSNPDAFSPDLVNCLYQDRAGTLWVCTRAGLKHLRDGQLHQYEDRSGLLGGAIWTVLEDRSGALWFGTEAGLVRSSGAQVTSYTTKDGLAHDRVTALFEDRSGALWIGTAQGLTRFDGEAFVTFREREGFVGSTVRAFHEDRDGYLWVGTYDGGLYRLAHQRLTRYTRADGLYDNGVFQILEDDDGYFWMGSNRGIQRVSRRELNEFAGGARQSVTAVAVGVRDGLTSVEVNGGRPPSGLKTADGRLWFPTMGGVAILDPAGFRTKPQPPQAIIEELHLDGKATAVVPPVRLDPRVLSFDIRYTAPSFVRPEQVKFRYRLSGFHQEWVEADTRREASFYGIPPGTYTFEVVAGDRDGSWSDSPASLSIAVLPPFWRTWWFASLMMVAIVALGLTAHQMRLRGLRQRHALQQRFARQLIDSQEVERRRISSEMHDSLGQELRIIKKLARSARDTDRQPSEALQEIEAVTERLQREMTDIAYGLRPHQLDNIGLSKTIESMIRRAERATGVPFVTEIARIDDVIPRDAHIHVFRIVQEGVSNVIEHAQASAAQVRIRRAAAHVTIEIEDNGHGVREHHHASGAGNGFWLMGIRERARFLGGHMEIRAAEPRGTLLRVTLLTGGGAHA